MERIVVRLDTLDYTTFWKIQHQGNVLHDRRCSSKLSGSWMCDCGAVDGEYQRLRNEQLKEAGNAPMGR